MKNYTGQKWDQIPGFVFEEAYNLSKLFAQSQDRSLDLVEPVVCVDSQKAKALSVYILKLETGNYMEI